MFPILIKEQKKIKDTDVLYFITENICDLADVFDCEEMEKIPQYDQREYIVEKIGEKKAISIANKWLKKHTKGQSAYVQYKKLYIAIDVPFDIQKGIENGIFKKSDAKHLIKKSKERGYYSYEEFKNLENLIYEKFPCFARKNDTYCINCGNCD